MLTFFCIIGSIALGIVVGVALFCATRRGSISIDIDIRQEPPDPL